MRSHQFCRQVLLERVMRVMIAYQKVKSEGTGWCITDFLAKQKINQQIDNQTFAKKL